MLLGAGCRRAPSPDLAKAEVQSALAAYDTLIVRMDASGIGASYLPDGEASDGDQAPIRGPEAIRQHLLGFAAFHVLANRLDADTTRLTADTAWQAGTYRQRVQVPAGDTVEVDGRFEVTWMRAAGGRWLIRRMHTFRPPAP